MTYTHNLPPEPQFPADPPGAEPLGFGTEYAAAALAAVSLTKGHSDTAPGVGPCSCDRTAYCPRHDEPEGTAPTTVAATKAEAWDEAASFVRAWITKWKRVPGLHPTAPEPHPAAYRAAGALRALDVVRSRLTEEMRDRAVALRAGEGE